MANKKWSPEEIEFVTKHQCDMFAHEIGKALGRTESAVHTRISMLKYPENHKTLGIYRSARQSGNVKRQPCEICGNENAQGHHPDYTRPLFVQWLCVKHHRELHHRARGEMKVGIPHGYQGTLALAAGISKSLLCAILKGRRTCKFKTAENLVKAAKKVLRAETNIFDWQFPGESKNPLFRNTNYGNTRRKSR